MYNKINIGHLTPEQQRQIEATISGFETEIGKQTFTIQGREFAIYPKDKDISIYLPENSPLTAIHEVLKVLPMDAGNLEYNANYDTEKRAQTPMIFQTDNDYYNQNIRMVYKSDGREVHISRLNPAPLIEAGLMLRSERNLSDTEYHYLTGVSMPELRKMKIPALRWNTNGLTSAWYKANYHLLDPVLINKIWELIKDLK